MTTKTLTAPLTLNECLYLAKGDRFAACILDCTTRKARGLFPFDDKRGGPWSVSAAELSALGYWSRFAGDGLGWPSEKDVPGRVAQIQPILAAAQGIVTLTPTKFDDKFTFRLTARLG
jgi:hypothetical protein